MKKTIKAWFKKKLKIASPSSCFRGYLYEYDELKSRKNSGKIRLIDVNKLQPLSIPIAPLFPEDDVHYEWVYLKSEVDAQPTVEERTKGKWLIRNVSFMPYNTAYECSNCGEWGRVQTFKMNYCPNCGAEMEKVRWNDEN